MEIEVPAENPRSFSKITRHKHHLIRLETVLMTIYYPSAFGTGAGKAPSGSQHWSRETWLPRPRLQTAYGYGKFAGIGSLAVPLFAATTMFTKLPAFRNAAPAQHWPPYKNMRVGGTAVKNQEGPPPEGEPEQPIFPMMIFSHGLGGSRTMYSSLCGEFASYGFVCVAVEHRDGSAPRTFVNHPKEGPGSFDDMDEQCQMEHTAKERKKGYDMVDYVFPKDNPMDTGPNNEKGVDQDLRDAQVELRLAEIEEAYRVMRIIEAGDGDIITKQNLRRKGYRGASSHGLEGVGWAKWKHRFLLKEVTILGHSFGGVTTVEVLRHPRRFHWISQGIIYDIWGAAVRHLKCDDDCASKIQLPILAINSEAFSYWESNYKLIHSLIDEARDQGALAWLMTVRGTVHVNQSDFSLLYPRLCSLALKMTADPRRAIDLNVNASLEFLKIVMPKRIAQINRAMQNQGLLHLNSVGDVTDLPQEEVHRPGDKWLAARLKIPHELRYRLNPRLVIQRHRMHKGNGDGDEGFIGLGKPNDEIWMHVAPTKEDLEAHGVESAEQRRTKGREGADDSEAARTNDADDSDPMQGGNRGAAERGRDTREEINQDGGRRDGR